MKPVSGREEQALAAVERAARAIVEPVGRAVEMRVDGHRLIYDAEWNRLAMALRELDEARNAG